MHLTPVAIQAPLEALKFCFFFIFRLVDFSELICYFHFD